MSVDIFSYTWSFVNEEIRRLGESGKYLGCKKYIFPLSLCCYLHASGCVSGLKISISLRKVMLVSCFLIRSQSQFQSHLGCTTIAQRSVLPICNKIAFSFSQYHIPKQGNVIVFLCTCSNNTENVSKSYSCLIFNCK